MKAVSFWAMLLFLACLVSGFFLSGCGDDDDDDSGSGPATDDDDAIDDDTGDDDDAIGGDVWMDSSSGLMWQVSPTGGKMNWSLAKTHCQELRLGEHNDWRLPTISELRSLVRGCDDTETGGDCDVTDSCLDCYNSPCGGCSNGGGPASGCYWPSQMEGDCSAYWSSSENRGDDDGAWYIYFGYGNVYNSNIGGDKAVRCVR